MIAEFVPGFFEAVDLGEVRAGLPGAGFPAEGEREVFEEVDARWADAAQAGLQETEPIFELPVPRNGAEGKTGQLGDRVMGGVSAVAAPEFCSISWPLK